MNAITPSVPQKQQASRPVIIKTFVFKTHPCHKVIDRVMYKALRALYATQVMLPILAISSAETDADEKLHAAIVERLDQTIVFFKKETEKLQKLKDDNGIDATGISYERTREIEVALSSPLGMRFVNLLVEMDKVVEIIDVLWWGGVFSDRQRAKAGFHLQGHMVKLGQQFVKLEGRARIACQVVVSKEELTQVAGVQTSDVNELAEGDHLATGDAKVVAVSDAEITASLATNNAADGPGADATPAAANEEAATAPKRRGTAKQLEGAESKD
jgi:hypothetical protein